MRAAAGHIGDRAREPARDDQADDEDQDRGNETRQERRRPGLGDVDRAGDAFPRQIQSGKQYLFIFSGAVRFPVFVLRAMRLPDAAAGGIGGRVARRETVLDLLVDARATLVLVFLCAGVLMSLIAVTHGAQPQQRRPWRSVPHLLLRKKVWRKRSWTACRSRGLLPFRSCCVPWAARP
jgi:hypothetical protein